MHAIMKQTAEGGDGRDTNTHRKAQTVIDFQAGRAKEVYENKLSSWEMDSLTALCDAFLPSAPVPNDVVLSADHQPTVAFFQTSAADTGTPNYIGGLMSQKLRSHAFLIRLSLVMLSTWVGTLILCGRKCISTKFPYFHKFSDLDIITRQQILFSWTSSWIVYLRMLFMGVKSLILLAFFTQVDDNNKNPSWGAIDYCGPNPNSVEQTSKPPDPTSNQRENNFGPLEKSIIDMSSAEETIAKALRQSGFEVSIQTNKTKNWPVHPNPILNIHCDVVVVGSGSGGGVIAGELAKAGYKILILEKGSYIARHNLSLLEGQSLNHMYESGGLLPTQDVNVMILAGSTVGGGSTINWSASIKTPTHVVKEWTEDHGLELFKSQLYKEAMDAVCEKMHVQCGDPEEEGLNNDVLRRGCKELGYPVENIPRNAPKDHYCGWCFMGCKDGRKKGTMETWLRDMEELNGGVILPSCEAIRVLCSKGEARGVEFEYSCGGKRKLGVVRAKVTVVACGALNTPVLLRRSGLKNGNIGKNLHLHPVAMAWGYFPEEKKRKRSYEGGIMTAMSPVVAKFEGTGYGALIQTPSLHPGLFSALIPWTSGLDIKVRMSKFSRTAHLLALARDTGSGEVSSKDPTFVYYELDKADEATLQKAIEKMLRILAAAGAEEIGTHHIAGPRINVKKASDHDMKRFIKEASTKALRGQATTMASAHQMGSCRMGIDPKTSVVDQRGETWEVGGLFVADTSVFPTALGVNPMVTVMAISYCIAQAILEVLKRKQSRS